jgi:hypothetical protein
MPTYHSLSHNNIVHRCGHLNLPVYGLTSPSPPIQRITTCVTFFAAALHPFQVGFGLNTTLNQQDFTRMIPLR